MLRVQRQAIEILLDAVNSEKWDDFIKNFVDNDNPKQLARLKLEDDLKEDPYIRQSVAYLLSNPTCGMDTPSRLSEFVGILDVGISREKLTVAAETQQSATDDTTNEEESKEQ
jgi:hypothetical protein